MSSRDTPLLAQSASDGHVLRIVRVLLPVAVLGAERGRPDADANGVPPGSGARLQHPLRCAPALEVGGAREEDLAAILDTTAFSSAAATLVRQAQHALLKKGVASAEDRLVAAKELLAPKLIAAGLAPPGDNAALETAARRALADDPEWTTYL